MPRFLLVSLIVCFISSQALVQNVQAIPDASSNPATHQDYSREAYVIEEMRNSYIFDNDGTGKHEFYVRVRVQSDAGVAQLGRVIVGYNSANERVEIPYVRVLKKDGSKIAVSTDSAQDVNPFLERDAPVYTDFHQKHIPVSGLNSGDVLEYDIVKTIHTALAPSQFWMQHDFESRSVVLNEQLEIDIPSGKTVKLKTKPGLDPTITDANRRRIYRWTHAHLETDDREMQKSSKGPKKNNTKRNPEQPDIQLTTFSDWDQVGRWYAGLERDRRTPTPEVRRKAEELTKDSKSELDKIEALYDYAAKNFRYISLSLGMGRYQPHAANDVLHNQYGDCKDKNTLLASLLESVGIHSSSVLINSTRKLDPEVPSPSQFDHVITLVPLGQRQVWVDTTTEVAPFQLLSSNLRDKEALVVGVDGASRLEKTPANPPFSSTSVQEVVGKIDDLGKLDAHVRFVERGDGELLMRMLFRKQPRANWEKFVEMMLTLAGTPGDVTELKVDDPAATLDPFEFSFHLEKSAFIDWSNKKIEMPLPISRVTLPEAETESESEPEAEPVILGGPGEHTYKLRLELPSRYTARTPLPFSMTREFATYEATYKLEGTVFTAEHKMVLRQREVPQNAVPGYVAFRRTVLADSAQHLSLESRSSSAPELPKNLNADELNDAGLEAFNNGNYSLAADVFKRAVEADPKHKWAWNNLGRAQLELKRVDDAITSFQKQIDVNAYDEYAYNNLGRAYRIQRNYEQASIAFRKQLDINPLDRWAHANLGGVYLDWHKYGEAVPELEKAAALAPDDAALQVELGKAQLNCGQDEKAMTAFDRALEISASPAIWNNIAYELSLKKVRLDKAKQYAESAVASISASLRNLNLDQVAPRDLYLVPSLAAYWDTLGWVYFAGGDLTNAFRYISAAWKLDQRSEIGDHLAQVLDKRGERDEAIRVYALALNATRPDPETRNRLATLLGGEDRVSSEIARNSEQLTLLRTLTVANPSSVSGTADFFVVLEPGTSVHDIKFVRGDEKLKSFAGSLRNVHYNVEFPDNTPTKILRRGTFSCPQPEGKCTFVMELPEDVKSVD